jgi:PAS domain S-box-containing protein
VSERDFAVRSVATLARPARVLLIEDNEGDARLVREFLREASLDVDLSWFRTLEEAVENGSSDDPDLLLLDLDLPGSQGADTVSRLPGPLADLPVVVLTGQSDEDVAVESLRAGAWEYLAKEELTSDQLSRTLRWSLERARLQERASGERALSRSVLESLSHHVAVVDQDGEIVLVNEAWQAFAAAEGGDPRGYEGDNYLEVTEAAASSGSPDALEMHRGLREVLAGEREKFSLEYPCHGPEVRRWFRVDVTPLRGDLITGAVVSHVDLTERKRTEQRLRRSETKWSTTVDLAPVGITITEVETGRVLETNAAAAGLLGYSPEAFRGATVEEIDSWVDRSRREEIVERVRSAGEVEDEIVRFRHRDGSVRHGRVSVRLIELEGTERLLWTLEDVTEIHRSNQRIRRQAAQQRVLAELGREALGTTDVDGLMDRIVEQVTSTLGTDCATVLDLQPGDGELLLRVARL